MSLYCFVDEEDMGQISTIQGWSDFVEWANQLTYYTLSHLSQHGYLTTNLSDFPDEIDAALKELPPDPDVESIILGLQEIARQRPNAEILIVSDGDGDLEIDDDD